MKTYQVGGSVRDELLGVEPNDKDFDQNRFYSRFFLCFVFVQTFVCFPIEIKISIQIKNLNIG